ncbi:uncharacterized protein M421DRAFT_8979 [Didymella exigua CBS 183.55]|uniref:Protein kinase domain-containing protein n=1 Tax=Didymella exigua CBS 183.55 TaxID=1150837 RepID=A0A6A5RAQ4_9PLEO|nr:uncharacterized protein M421DRAFT_8979 [Didymella exigua CBS 183.55]KAF1924144.1 hypothetical protein M421DRAFT_8979 [Didymella exigua CBS 183.55]
MMGDLFDDLFSDEAQYLDAGGIQQDSDDESQYYDTAKGVSAKTLKQTLQSRLIKSEFDKTPHSFIPEGIVEELITRKSIAQCLRASREQLELIDYTFAFARKAFAIATFARLNTHVAMNWFKRTGMTDDDLPFTVQSEEFRRSSWRTHFYDEQWKFFAPIFDTGKYNHDFEEARILPVVSKLRVAGSGAFGEVCQYEIHTKHLQPIALRQRLFAIKELKAEANLQERAEHWEKEVKALRMMNKLNQAHIVRFITAFRRKKRNDGEEHYLMFEWANGGNLRDLWDRIPSPNLTGTLVKSVVKQILGLASALAAAHNLNQTEASYRHGDLKPENILIFDEEPTVAGNERERTVAEEDRQPIGTFKIGDWGEAKYYGKDQPTELRSQKTTARFGTRRYEAPEVVTGVTRKYLGQPVKRRSRLYDIWAMGCIILELMIWLLYGVEGYHMFRQNVSETFYQIKKENTKTIAQVHSAATRWMDYMAQEPACEINTAMGQLLEFVRNNLLVVKLPRRMGSFRPSPEDTDQSRTDSFLEPKVPQDLRSDLNQALENAHLSEPSALNGLPTFTITEPEPTSDLDKNHTREPVQPEPELPGHSRCLASDFYEAMDGIHTEDDVIGFWETHPERDRTPLLLNDPISSEVGTSGDAEKDYAPSELDEKDWVLRLDNEVASRLFTDLRCQQRLDTHPAPDTAMLCDWCSKFRTQFGPGFSMTYDVSRIQTSAETGQCHMCSLLWHICQAHEGQRQQSVRFDREGAFLKMSHTPNCVLSVVCSPDVNVPVSGDYQIGFVDLPVAGGETHLEVMKSWLHDCDHDAKHTCKPSGRASGGSSTSIMRLPTRLIKVGKQGDATIQLWETRPGDAGEWIALSHKWGDSHFSTTTANREQHLEGLNYASLPATFKDAVTVTRALGHQYLWIDSLCVIQGPDGDFESEAKRMEDVYSGAYCVLAASCAADHYDGFLKPRKARKYVRLTKEGKNEMPFYICETIDDFKSHVLDGDLSGRGWVLQEHALARRTLFFTEYQTYFECGGGVRCETSTRLENLVAALLGDAEFPDLLYRSSQGDRITRIQGLYKQYSKLGLSKPYDRPVAIAGLQQRLLRTMRVYGDFGILDEGETRGLLRRTLLWRRHSDSEAMKRIDFSASPGNLKIPSWSWMAYSGAVDYIYLEFGQYEWNNIQSPWTKLENRWINVDAETAKIALFAAPRRFDTGAAKDRDIELVFDEPSNILLLSSLCVVLGVAKGSQAETERKHCVLVITPRGEKDGVTLYERVGTGFLPGKCLAPPQDNFQLPMMLLGYT